MRVHLDLLGGLAGDMFIAGVLDAFPQHEPGVLASIAALAPAGGGASRLLPHRDHVLQGRRFQVDAPAAAGVHDHGHTPWRAVRARLAAADLPAPVVRHATAIFSLLADAEAQVHGVAADAVEFHEVGAWDSIADIVGAAHLLHALQATRWTVSAIPLGHGRVRTAHGPMPVPAPATALLLQGFATLDDGIGGERVTPTGAALIRYLCDAGGGHSGNSGSAAAAALHLPARLLRCGVGFGTRQLPGISNCVRVLAFDTQDDAAAAATGPGHRQLAVIEFEVDDQSAEDLAMGLDHLRAHPAIFDVVQAPVFGKKGRMMTAVRVLASPAAVDAAIEACFRETTTIGLRHRLVHGAALARQQHSVGAAGATLRVKSVARPGGRTAKAESDDVASHAGHAVRQALRAQAEAAALQVAAAAPQGLAHERAADRPPVADADSGDHAHEHTRPHPHPHAHPHPHPHPHSNAHAQPHLHAAAPVKEPSC